MNSKKAAKNAHIDTGKSVSQLSTRATTHSADTICTYDLPKSKYRAVLEYIKSRTRKNLNKRDFRFRAKYIFIVETSFYG